MNTIGLNSIRIDRVGVDPIRLDAMQLSVLDDSSKRSRIDPDVLASLCGVWIAEQNNNDSPARNIIKNKLSNKGGDFEILNADFVEGSGYKDGAFCTDGVNDLIVSRKSIREMLQGSSDITIISMICKINGNFTNYVRKANDGFIRVKHAPGISDGKTGIYGFTIGTNINTINISGDKNDYAAEMYTKYYDAPFSVEGFLKDGVTPAEVCKVKWYWTLIAKRVLTIDEIKQVISYFKLDKYMISSSRYTEIPYLNNN